MKDVRSRRIIMALVLAACILHLLGLLFLLAWQHHTQEHEKKFQKFMETVREQVSQNPENSENSEWAEMRAKASEFGTTVFFQDEPEFTPPPSIIQESRAPEKKESQLKTWEKLDKKDMLSSEKVQDLDKELTNILKAASQTIVSTNQLYSASSTEGMNGSSKKEGAPKPPLTLSTIAKGFLSTLDHGGRDSMSMNGKKGAHPSAEQLNYQRYMEKFARCVSNSHNIHKNKLPHMQIRVPVSVAISLTRDGTLKDSYIALSTGIKAIDDYILFIHRDAAPGFPPVPSSIKDELLNFTSQGIVIIGSEQTPFSFSMR